MNISSLINHTCELYSLIDKWDRPSDKIISEYFKTRKYLGSKDRAFIINKVYGLIRNKMLLEELYKIIFGDKNQIDIPLLLYINSVLNDDDINISQFFNSISNLKPVILEKYKNLLNEIHIRFSFPKWMILKFEKVIPKEEMNNFLESLNTPAPITIRVAKKNSEKEIYDSFKRKGIELFKCKIAPDAYFTKKRVNFYEFKLFKKGYFEVQDEGSQLVTLYSEPKNKSTILDACSGAGGKSLYLSSLIKDKGVIYSYDIDLNRIQMFRKRLKGKGYNNIKIIESKDELKTLENQIDLVVIDAPCTGSGTIRRNPDLKWRLKEEDLIFRAKIQKSILEEYAKYVKKDGLLTYITCSFFVEENEDIISEFLEKNKSFHLISNDDFFDRFNIVNHNNILRLYPHIHNTDGFTAFLLKRKD